MKCGTDLYSQNNSWDNTPKDYFKGEFHETQIRFYNVRDPKHGRGVVSVDGGIEISFFDINDCTL
jgi:hypothetical protein